MQYQDCRNFNIKCLCAIPVILGTAVANKMKLSSFREKKTRKVLFLLRLMTSAQ